MLQRGKRAWRRKGHCNVAGLPQGDVWARLDPLNGQRYALVPDVSNTAGAASMLIGWGDPVFEAEFWPRTRLRWISRRAM